MVMNHRHHNLRGNGRSKQIKGSNVIPGRQQSGWRVDNMDMVDIDMVFTNIVDMDMADMDHFADLSRKFGLLSSKFFIEQYLSSSFSFGFP